MCNNICNLHWHLLKIKTGYLMDRGIDIYKICSIIKIVNIWFYDVLCCHMLKIFHNKMLEKYNTVRQKRTTYMQELCLTITTISTSLIDWESTFSIGSDSFKICITVTWILECRCYFQLTHKGNKFIQVHQERSDQVYSNSLFTYYCFCSHFDHCISHYVCEKTTNI
jgi:hypothetical protein